MSMQHRVQLPIKEDLRYKNFYCHLPVEYIFPDEEVINVYKQWCKDRVGVNGWNYYGKYRKVPCEFRFKNPGDLVAFKLTFGV